MNKKQLATNIAHLLKENDVKKAISVPKQTFSIQDNEGNSKNFYVQQIGKRVEFTIEDIVSMLDAFVLIVQDAIQHGDTVCMHGFGTFGLKYRKPRKSRLNGEERVIPGRYVPKFSFGNDMRRCAKLFEARMNDEASAGDTNTEEEVEE